MQHSEGGYRTPSYMKASRDLVDLDLVLLEISVLLRAHNVGFYAKLGGFCYREGVGNANAAKITANVGVMARHSGRKQLRYRYIYV